jgi:3-oxoacyl-ACP reductase-like protein
MTTDAPRFAVAASALILGASLVAAQTTPAPAPVPTTTPAQTPAAPPTAVTPAATPAPAPAAAPAAADNPFDQILNTTRPFAADNRSAPSKVTSATTKDCVTTLALEGSMKLTIDLKKMQGLSVNTNLMISGGGQSVQLEFEGKDGTKSAAAADKALAALNDKCAP